MDQVLYHPLLIPVHQQMTYLTVLYSVYIRSLRIQWLEALETTAIGTNYRYTVTFYNFSGTYNAVLTKVKAKTTYFKRNYPERVQR